MKIGFVILLTSLLLSYQNKILPQNKQTLIDTLPQGKKIDSLKSSHIYPDVIDKQNILKADISKNDSSFSVFGSISKDYRIFGYQKPDTNAKRLILFSVFTRDVENNPYHCEYGAYYQTSSMNNSEIKFKSVIGSFVKTELYINGLKTADLFFEKKWVNFSE
jgi:hypothetical protein